jgi:hypothetical protein
MGVFHLRSLNPKPSMKKISLLLAAACGFAFIACPAFAQKASGPKAKLMAKYDKNSNGVIDGDEIEAVRKDFAAEPNGDLKRYDTDKDGKLSATEIAEIKPPGSKKGGDTKSEKGKGKEKEKTPAADATSPSRAGESNPPGTPKTEPDASKPQPAK